MTTNKFEILMTKTEAELRDYKLPTIDSKKELEELLEVLVSRQHDYGTCVYAMSIAAEAAFNFVANRLGVTGFQASCADMNFLARVRRMEDGFRILDYRNLLYPQYIDRFVNFELSREVADRLQKKATKMLSNESDDSPLNSDVREHWKNLSQGIWPDGIIIN